MTTLAEEARRLQFVEDGLCNAIALEAQRYIEAVELFRSEGCEPHWAPESLPSPLCKRRPASRPPSNPPRRTSC